MLVSETILQQTQVARGGPAWAAFVERFPTVEALAAASPGDVLRAWRGLGYNRRAINLQRAARIVVDELGGRVPDATSRVSSGCPGVGPYTARAVAVDRLRRCRSARSTRTSGGSSGGRSPASAGGDPARPDLQALADALVPVDRSGATGPPP